MRDDNEWLDLQLLFVFLSKCDASVDRSTAGTKSRFGLKRFTGPCYVWHNSHLCTVHPRLRANRDGRTI